MSKKKQVKEVIGAATSALLLVLAFPRFDIEALAWVGFIPLLIVLEGKTVRRAFFLSFLAGLLFFTSLCSWVLTVKAFNFLDFFILGSYLALYVGLWGGGLAWLRQATGYPLVLIAPPLWVTLEYLRSHMSFLSAPWMLLGHSQYLQSSLLQFASVTGAYGLSFLIMLVNATMLEAVSSIALSETNLPLAVRGKLFPWFSMTITGLLFLGVTLYGVWVVSQEGAQQQVTLAVVQGNISQEQRWQRTNRSRIIAQYAQLTYRATQYAPALIIWPETAVPGDIQHSRRLRQEIEFIARTAKTPLLVGSGEKAIFTDRELANRYYNNMVLFSAEGSIDGYYRKIRLVPFAEYVPLRSMVTWPQTLAAALGDFLPGEDYTLFTIGEIPFGAVICWELIFPDLFREFVNRGAQFMVIATNEAWFGNTSAPYQLLAMSAFRAAENRIAIARAANTGISAFIDPFGRISQRLTDSAQRDLFVEGVLVGHVPLAETRTFYTQYGDVFALLQISMCILLGLAAGRRVD